MSMDLTSEECAARAPLFDPLAIGQLELPNRLAVALMTASAPRRTGMPPCGKVSEFPGGSHRGGSLVGVRLSIHYRRVANACRSSEVNSCGCSIAAKCPPRSSSLKWINLGKVCSAQLRGTW